MPRRRRRSKKWISRLIVLFLLIVAGVIVYLVWDGYFRDKSSDSAGETGGDTLQIDEKGEFSDNAESFETPTELEEDSSIKRKAVQYDGESPNEYSYLTGAISYAGISGDKLLIRVSIDQYLEEGTCELVLSQDNKTIYQGTADIMGDATTSTCKGFDIPSDILNGDNVQFTVYFSSGDRMGEVSGGIEL